MRSHLAWMSNSSGGMWNLLLSGSMFRAAADGVDGDLVTALDRSGPASAWLRRSPNGRFPGWNAGDDGSCTVFLLRQGQRMTLYQTFPGGVLVFRSFQDRRLHAAAEQFPDRPRPLRRDPAADAVCAARAPADGDVARAACDLRASRRWPISCSIRWSSRFPKWDSSRGEPDGIIVLGGPLDADLSAAHGVPVIRRGRPDHQRRRRWRIVIPRRASSIPAAART